MYWTKRIDKQNELLYDKTLEQTEAKLAKQYMIALKDIQKEIEALYDKVEIDAGNNKIRMNDLYKYNRYFDLMSKINKKLTSLGYAEQKIYDENLLFMYGAVQDVITKNSIGIISNSYVPDGKAEEVLKSVWCADGKHWSDRVWDNKKLLQASIEKGLVDCVVRGVPKDEWVKQLKREFGMGFSSADRLARTELSFVQNQACADRYQNAGVKKYEILSASDARTSEICKEQNGKTYDFNKMKVGVNYPPFHPNCRTTIIPVLGD